MSRSEVKGLMPSVCCWYVSYLCFNCSNFIFQILCFIFDPFVHISFIDDIICVPRISQFSDSIFIHINIFHYCQWVCRLSICFKYAHCIKTSIIIRKSWLPKTVLFWSIMRIDSSVIHPFIRLETGIIPSNALGSPSRKLVVVFIWSRKIRSSLDLAMSTILCPVCRPCVSRPCLKPSKDKISLDNSISMLGGISNVTNPLV